MAKRPENTRREALVDAFNAIAMLDASKGIASELKRKALSEISRMVLASYRKPGKKKA